MKKGERIFWIIFYVFPVVANICIVTYLLNMAIDVVRSDTKIEAIKMSAGKTIKAHTPCIIRAKVADADHTQNIVVNNAILRKSEYKSID